MKFTKKLTAIFLAVLMMFSCIGVVANAEDGTGNTNEGNPIRDLLDKLRSQLDFEAALGAFENGGFNAGDYLDSASADDIDKLIASGLLSNVDFLGISLDFLYDSNDPLWWSRLPVSKSDLTIVKANINTYLANALSSVMGGDYLSPNFLTAKNASKLINFIGHILDPNFVDVGLSTIYVDGYEDYTYDSYIASNVFYSVVSQLSGLTEAIRENWINHPKIKFSPVLYLLGFDFNDDAMLGKDKIANAGRIGPILVKSILKQVCRMGPLEYILLVTSRLASTYGVATYEPILALLKGQVAAGATTAAELRTLKGLFNVLFGGRNGGFEFVSAPAYRFAKCTKVINGKTETDTTEMFLYTLIYTNLCGFVEANKNAAANLKTKVYNEEKLNDTQKSTICTVIDGFFGGDVSGFVGAMIDMLLDNVAQVPESIFTTIKDFFQTFWENIANFFAKIFDSILNFGKF